ncbi:YaiI/YqxD family protein [Syntrophomonas palmitatica]|uniref:YaiI/YqxD family protein n=1 Tax=Syntrophomonas palmitatica TaxID=402877 RepID=UPI0006D1C803|nr:DUF188 domain-containing protein [Syntrophomonas palmitatica]
MKIIVDGDACPRSVLKICMEMGKKYNIPVWTVASFNHHIESDHHVVVGNSAQEADLKVVNLTGSKDIVVTQDWGLAAIILGKGALAVSPAGRVYLSQTIDFLLEEREIKSKVRRAGGRTKGPRKRTAADDKRFADKLEQIITANL